MGIVSRLIREFRGPVSKLTVKVRMPGMRRLRRHLKTVDGLATSAAGSVAALNDELESLGERLTVSAISGEVLELIERESALARADLETPEFPDDDRKHFHRETVLVSPGDDWIEIAGINCEGIPTVTLLTCTETLGGDRLALECFVCNVDDVLTIGQRKPGEGVAFKRSQEPPKDGRVIAAALAGLSDEELLAKRDSLMPKVKVQVPMPPVKPPRAMKTGPRSVDLRGSSVQAYVYREHLIDILAELYENELNVRIESFWDEGWKVSLGDEMNGFVTTWEEDTLGAAITGIESEVLIHYPKSEFALKRTGHRDKGATMSEERMGRFTLVRHEDETGVSGTGTVAEGVRFRNGKCAMAWLTDVSSVAVYDSMKDLIKIHGHNGKTEVVWHD